MRKQLKQGHAQVRKNYILQNSITLVSVAYQSLHYRQLHEDLAVKTLHLMKTSDFSAVRSFYEQGQLLLQRVSWLGVKKGEN